jgi:hypothetical protein
MRDLIKRLFCKHDYQFVRNIYGDEIITFGWKRSISKCTKCGNYKLFDNLQTEECKMGKFYDTYQQIKEREEEVKELHRRGLRSEGVNIPVKPVVFADGVKYPADDKPENIKRFELLGAEKALLYARKNADYGDSFNKSLDEDGLLVAKIRLGDKFLRFSQLINNPAQVTEEKLRETLIDLSNYTDMTIMWLDAKEESDNMKKHDDAMDALAHAVVASGADWDGDFVDGHYVNLKEGVVKPIKATNPNLVDADNNVYNIHIHADASMTPEKIASLVNDSMKKIGVRNHE